VPIVTTLSRLFENGLQLICKYFVTGASLCFDDLIGKAIQIIL
jgi:hypothetical protein